MIHIVWAAGAITAIMGIAILFRPLWMRQLITFISKSRTAYAAAGLKTLVGIVFLVLATGCRRPKVIIALGVLMTVGPILFCMLPFAKIQAYMNWWVARPVWMYRVWGVLLGGFIICAGMPK